MDTYRPPERHEVFDCVLVTFISFVIIVQADNIIDHLKDFTALMVISEVDNILFQLASHGCLVKENSKVKVRWQETHQASKTAPR